MNWYEKPMRIGALQCNFEKGSPLAVIERWRRMGMNVEQLFHPMADGYSALFDERRHGPILRRYLARAHQRGLRVILYLNCHIIGPSDAGRYRLWAQRRADGTFPMLYGTYYACCLNSPWRDVFLAAIDALARYNVDGIFLDGPVAIGEGCHCRFCRAKHREWFGRPQGAEPAGFDFKWRSQASFLEETYRRFKRARPEGLMYQNLPVEHPRASSLEIRQVLAWNDIVGTEGGFMFYGPPKNAGLWRPGHAARLLEALAPDKGRVIFMAGDQKPWSWYPHAPAETALCIASCSANGAGVWYGLHGSTRLLATPGGRAARRMFRFLERRADLYANTISAARIALLHSYETDTAWGGALAESDFYGRSKGDASLAGNPQEAMQGFADMLTRDHWPHDLVTDLDLTVEKLQRYETLVLPGVPCMSRATAAAIREYVRHGGNLVAAFNTSLHDEQGRQRRDFALGDVFGARALGRITSYANFNYFVPRRPVHTVFDGVEIPLLPAPPLAMDIRTRPGSRVLADFLKPLAGRYVPLTGPGCPALVLNRFGRGRCLYLAGAFGEGFFAYTHPVYRLMLTNALRMYAPSSVRLENAAGPVEVTVRRQADRLLIHLVNHSSFDQRPLETVQPLQNVSVRLPRGTPVRTAEAAALGRKLTVKRAAYGSRILLPELNEYEVIMVR